MEETIQFGTQSSNLQLHKQSILLQAVPMKPLAFLVPVRTTHVSKGCRVRALFTSTAYTSKPFPKFSIKSVFPHTGKFSPTSFTLCDVDKQMWPVFTSSSLFLPFAVFLLHAAMNQQKRGLLTRGNRYKSSWRAGVDARETTRQGRSPTSARIRDKTSPFSLV